MSTSGEWLEQSVLRCVSALPDPLRRRIEGFGPVVAIPWRQLARQLAGSPSRAVRGIGTAMHAASGSRDFAAAEAMYRTAERRTDLRAEKIVSDRYGFVWLCNPKVASRSMIDALCRVDPQARLIVGTPVDDILLEHPEAREYFSFAFVRDPSKRVLSFYRDKLVRRSGPVGEYLDDVVPHYHGLDEGMGFPELCRWLCTPFGSDEFADRHWLSQNRQIRIGERLPDYIGRYENLDADWREVASRIGMPHVALPRLNRSPTTAAEPMDDATIALLRYRYAEDFELWQGLAETPGRDAG